MPLLECIIECVRVCFKCRCNCVYLCKPVRVCVRERREWVSEVCYIIQHAFFKNHWGWNHPQTPSTQWWGMVPFAPLDWANARHNLNMACISIFALWNQCINMDATNERVGLFIAFCMFDLQINWPQFTLMRFAPHNLTRFQSQALILAVVLSACGAVPIPFCCRTHDCDLLILITAIILFLGAVLPVAWHTRTQNWCNTLKLWKAMVSSLNCQVLNVSARQRESQPGLCFGACKGVLWQGRKLQLLAIRWIYTLLSMAHIQYSNKSINSRGKTTGHIEVHWHGIHLFAVVWCQILWFGKVALYLRTNSSQYFPSNYIPIQHSLSHTQKTVHIWHRAQWWDLNT